jgi:hypothetical protein
MAHAESRVTIDRPVIEVFDYIADGRNNVHWRAGIRSAELDSESGGTGASYRQQLQGPLGSWQRIPWGYRITGYSRPDALSFQQSRGLARPNGSFTCVGIGPQQTKVTFTLDWQPKGLLHLIDSMLEAVMLADVGSLSSLKRVLEAGGNPTPG